MKIFQSHSYHPNISCLSTCCLLPTSRIAETWLTKEYPLSWRIAPSSDTTFCLHCSSNLTWIFKLAPFSHFSQLYQRWTITNYADSLTTQALVIHFLLQKLRNRGDFGNGSQNGLGIQLDIYSLNSHLHTWYICIYLHIWKSSSFLETNKGVFTKIREYIPLSWIPRVTKICTFISKIWLITWKYIYWLLCLVSSGQSSTLHVAFEMEVELIFSWRFCVGHICVSVIWVWTGKLFKGAFYICKYKVNPILERRISVCWSTKHSA